MSSKEPSPPRATRAEQKDATRRALLDAARACFADRGFAATVVADVVRAAKVAHGTFYVHFESLEAIADALLAEVNAALAARLVPVLAAAGRRSRERTVREVARAFLDVLDEDRPFVRWYAERAAAGLPSAALAEGVNPPALAALGPVLGAAVAEVSPARLSLALHGLLSLWLRVGLRYVLVPDVDRADAEAVLVSITVGALVALEALPSAKAPVQRPRDAHRRSHAERRT